MTTTEPTLVDAVLAAQESTKPLPADLAEALVEELTADPARRGYSAALAGPDWTVLRALLYGSYSVHQEAGRVPRTQIRGSELKGWLRDVPLAKALQLGGAVAQKWLLLSAANMPSIADNDIYNPQGQMLEMFYPQMLQDGILTQEQKDAFTTQERPEAWLPQPARASEVLGQGIIVDVADLEALREAGRI